MLDDETLPVEEDSAGLTATVVGVVGDGRLTSGTASSYSSSSPSS